LKPARLSNHNDRLLIQSQGIWTVLTAVSTNGAFLRHDNGAKNMNNIVDINAARLAQAGGQDAAQNSSRDFYKCEKCSGHGFLFQRRDPDNYFIVLELIGIPIERKKPHDIQCPCCNGTGMVTYIDGKPTPLGRHR
jgi:hypothetical protein